MGPRRRGDDNRENATRTPGRAHASFATRGQMRRAGKLSPFLQRASASIVTTYRAAELAFCLVRAARSQSTLQMRPALSRWLLPRCYSRLRLTRLRLIGGALCTSAVSVMRACRVTASKPAGLRGLRDDRCRSPAPKSAYARTSCAVLAALAVMLAACAPGMLPN